MQPVLEKSSISLDLISETLVFLGLPPAREPEDAVAVVDVVEKSDFLGEANEIVRGHYYGRRAESGAREAACQISQDLNWVRRQDVTCKVMFKGKDGINTTAECVFGKPKMSALAGCVIDAGQPIHVQGHT
jgi:hypothetical protein